MKHRAWVWLAACTGCVALIGACGGNALDAPGGASSSHGGQKHTSDAAGAGNSPSGQNPPVLGGSGNVGPGSSGAGNTTDMPAQGGDTGAHKCTGDFDEVAAVWGACPATLCAGMAWAESCPLSHSTTDVETCGALTVITLDLSTHGMSCYYQSAVPRGGSTGDEPKLVGAVAWDDVPTFCNQTSSSIEAGATTANCDAHTNASRHQCDGDTIDGAGGAAGAGGSDAAPAAGPPACFNAFSHSCEPCCPTQAPECTGKPNGYPGYDCTPAPSSFCSCQCQSEKWSCGC